MYSDTKEKIVNIIKESNGVSAHAIIRTLNKNASGIFRHLKNLAFRGLITKIGKPPKVLYYYQDSNQPPTKIQLSKFGHILTSRQNGREAYLSAKAYLLPKNPTQKVEIDFSGVEILSPGWADEVITPIKKEFGDKLIFLPSDNSSVMATLNFLYENNDYKQPNLT